MYFPIELFQKVWKKKVILFSFDTKAVKCALLFYFILLDQLYPWLLVGVSKLTCETDFIQNYR